MLDAMERVNRKELKQQQTDGLRIRSYRPRKREESARENEVGRRWLGGTNWVLSIRGQRPGHRRQATPFVFSVCRRLAIRNCDSPVLSERCLTLSQALKLGQQLWQTHAAQVKCVDESIIQHLQPRSFRFGCNGYSVL